MGGLFGSVVAAAANGVAEADQKLQQQSHRVGLGVWQDGRHHLAGKPVIGGRVHGRPGRGRVAGRGLGPLAVALSVRGKLLHRVVQRIGLGQDAECAHAPALARTRSLKSLTAFGVSTITLQVLALSSRAALRAACCPTGSLSASSTTYWTPAIGPQLAIALADNIAHAGRSGCPWWATRVAAASVVSSPSPSTSRCPAGHSLTARRRGAQRPSVRRLTEPGTWVNALGVSAIRWMPAKVSVSMSWYSASRQRTRAVPSNGQFG